MLVWSIPMVYTAVSLACGLILPRLEHFYLGSYSHAVSVGSALAFYSSVSSGMMAFTGFAFAIAFVMVQFSAVAYTPRLVIMLSSNPTLFHTLGVFFATFAYSLAALVWIDRGGSQSVPLFSAILVIVLLIISMLAFSRLVQSISNLQIHNVLQVIGRRGRTVIGAFRPITDRDPSDGRRTHVGQLAFGWDLLRTK